MLLSDKKLNKAVEYETVLTFISDLESKIIVRTKHHRDPSLFCSDTTTTQSKCSLIREYPPPSTTDSLKSDNNWNLNGGEHPSDEIEDSQRFF